MVRAVWAALASFVVVFPVILLGSGLLAAQPGAVAGVVVAALLVVGLVRRAALVRGGTASDAWVGIASFRHPPDAGAPPRQHDPDASGHVRPRAPGRSPQAA